MQLSKFTWNEIKEKVSAFFLTPASARPLAMMRIGLALVLIAEAYLIRHEIMNFFAHDGLVQGELAHHMSDPDAPRLAWLVDHLKPFGIAEEVCLFWATRIYFASLILLCLGLGTRLAAFTAWLLQWTFINTGYSNPYGVDMFAHIFLFYLMISPCNGAYSLDLLLRGKKEVATVWARVCLRVAQLHLALSYFATSIEKGRGIQWWNGELIWRSLTLPEYYQYDFSWLAHWPLVAMMLGWGTLLIEGGFCFFVWPKRTRMIWIALTVSLHVGIAIFLGLQVFGAIMCVFCTSLFAISAERNTELSAAPAVA